MPRVLIPGPLRVLAGGAEWVTVPGATVGEAIESLDERYPGLAARLRDGDQLAAGIAAAVDGVVSRQGLRQRLVADSELLFVWQIAGG